MNEPKLIVRKISATEKNIGDTVVREYFTPGDLPELGLAVAEINSRYPSSGFAINTSVEEMYFVLSGQGTIFYEGKVHGRIAIVAEDALRIPKGTKYYVEGKNLKLVVPTAPSWFKKQHKWVE